MWKRIDLIRVVGALALLLSALLLPWWVSVGGMILLAARSPSWEVICIGFLIDCLWLPTDTLIYPVPIFTIGAVLVVWGLEPMRRLLL